MAADDLDVREPDFEPDDDYDGPLDEHGNPIVGDPEPKDSRPAEAQSASHAVDPDDDYDGPLDEHGNPIVTDPELDEEDEDEDLENIARAPEIPTGPGTMRDDIAPFESAASETSPNESYVCWSDDDDKTRHYDGPLGQFDFDPKEFDLAKVHVPENEYGAAKDVIVLRYKGTETDGRNIHVPEGITDVSYMFMGSDIESTPRLPSSVKMATQTYMSCSNLKEAISPLPEGLEDTSFMFADCPRLVVGPSRLPDSLKHADYMFVDDPKLENVPRVGANIKSMNGAFAYCSRLEGRPNVPDQAQAETKNITLGCTRIDRQEAQDADKKLEKQRQRAEKRANSVGFMGHVASMCSAVAQYHALRQQGFNIITAPYMVHKMRQSGRLGKNWSDMLAATTKDKAKQAQYINMSHDKDASRAAKAKHKMEVWDDMHGPGSKVTRQMKHMVASGERDFKTNLFVRIQTKEASEREGYEQTQYGKKSMYDAMADNIADMAKDGTLPRGVRKSMAQTFIGFASENAAYYRSAQNAIMTGSRGDVQKENLAGLSMMTEMMNTNLIDTVRTLQTSYDLFDERDRNQMNMVMRQMGYQEDIFAVDPEAERGAAQFGRGVQMDWVAREDMPRPEPEAAPETAPVTPPVPEQTVERAPVAPPETTSPPEQTAERAPVAPPPPVPEAAPVTPPQPTPEQTPVTPPEQTSERAPVAPPPPTPERTTEAPPAASTPATAQANVPVRTENDSVEHRTMGEAVREAGGNFARAARSKFGDFLARSAASAAAAREAFVGYNKPAPEDEAGTPEVRPASSGPVVAGGDVADIGEQKKLDQAVADSRLRDAAQDAQRRANVGQMVAGGDVANIDDQKKLDQAVADSRLRDAAHDAAKSSTDRGREAASRLGVGLGSGPSSPGSDRDITDD